MKYWIIKSEPKKYPWDKMQEDKTTFWDGVRNYEARNNLRAMKKGDICFFYHSNDEKAIVGMTQVVKEAYQDPTTDDTNWVCVDVKFKKSALRPLTLKEMKDHAILSQMSLVKRSRLSVTPVTDEEAQYIMDLAFTK